MACTQVNGLRGWASLADRVKPDNFYIHQWSPLARSEGPGDDSEGDGAGDG